MLVLSVIGAVWWNRQQLAERQRQIAFARQLAARSDASLKSWPLRSVLLALEAVKQGHDPQGRPIVAAEQALRHALGATGGILLRGHDDALTVVAFSPDGRWLAIAGRGGNVRLQDLAAKDPATGGLLLQGKGKFVRSAAFSPNSRWLATARTRKVRAYGTCRLPTGLRGLSFTYRIAAFPKYGRRVGLQPRQAVARDRRQRGECSPVRSGGARSGERADCSAGAQGKRQRCGV
jgi:hypothetical protein